MKGMIEVCYANEVVKEMERLIDKAISKQDVLRKQLSDYDKQISQLYHFIEMSKNLSGSKGFSTYRDLRELLRKRRLVKHELATLKTLFATERSTIEFSVKAIASSLKKQENSFKDYTKNWNAQEMEDVANTFDDVFEKEFQRQF